jgi:hypothetical protein
MSTDSVPSKPPEPPPPDVFAALLSYVVPGLGQFYQGRVGKGLLFMVSLLGMFFYGMHLGNWSNVYLPRDVRESGWLAWMPKWMPGRGGLVATVEGRLAFAGQFWIGAAAWPAILQYNEKWPVAEKARPFWRDFQRTPSERTLNELQASGNKTWDLGWVYTVIAGVLNILVIYDALAGAAFAVAATKEPSAGAAVPREAPAL